MLALQGATLDSRIARLVDGPPLIETLHVVRPDDRIVTGAQAVLALGRLAPRWRVLALPLGRDVPTDGAGQDTDPNRPATHRG